MPLGNGMPLFLPGYRPYTNPDVAHLDRFHGASLGSWWTNPAVTGQTVTLTFLGPGLTIAPAIASKHFSGIRMPAPSGAFTAIAQMVENGPNTSDIRAGMYAGVSGSTGWVVGPFNQDGAIGYIGVSTISDSADWSGYNGQNGSAGGSVTVLRYYRIQWNGSTTLSFDYSADGLSWTNLATKSASAPAEIGVGVYSNSGVASTSSNITVYQWTITQP